MPIDFNDLSTVTLFMLCRYDCILCNFTIINPSSEENKIKIFNFINIKEQCQSLGYKVDFLGPNFKFN